MGKKKNKKTKKTIQPNSTVNTVKQIYTQPEKLKAELTAEKYVSRRKRDIERENREREAELKAAERAAAEREQREKKEREAAENALFFVENTPDEADTKSKQRKKRVKPVKERPVKVKKEKPPKQLKPKKQPKRLMSRTDAENPEAIAEYLEKINNIEEWNRRFNRRFYRTLSVILCAAIIFIVLWNTEAARISVEGRGAYEISVNIFNMVSHVREADTAAIINEEKVKTGSAGFAVYRIIDDMYSGGAALKAYEENEPVLIGVYGPELYTSVFEKHDFSNGRANMQVRRALKQDKKYIKKYGITLGRSTLIREYTEKYGGELEENLEALKSTPIMKIIDRESVTDEAAKAIDDIFSKRTFVAGDDVPMVITDNSTPPPAAQPAAAPQRTAAPKTKTNGGGGSSRRRTSSWKGSSDTRKSSSAGDDEDSNDSTKSTAAPDAKPIPPTASATAKPLAPIREVARPTANPIVTK